MDAEEGEERDTFLDFLSRFSAQRGLRCPQQSVRSRFPLDSRLLFVSVLRAGGSQKVTDNKLWAQIGRQDPGYKPSMTDVSYKTKRAFVSLLLPLEKEYANGMLFPGEMAYLAGIDSKLPPPNEIAFCSGAERSISESISLEEGAASYSEHEKELPQMGRSTPQRHVHPWLPRHLPSTIAVEELANKRARVGIHWKELGIYSFATVIGWSQGSDSEASSLLFLHVEHDDGEAELIDINREHWVILNSESCPTVEVATLHGGTNADVSIIPTPSGADAQNQGPSMGSLEILGGPLCTSTDSIKAKDAENESGLAERRESNTLAANYDGEGATTWRRRAAIAVGPSYAVFQTACASSGFEIYVDLETKSATNLVVRAFKRSVKISHVQSVASSSGPKEVLIKLPRSIIPQTAQALLSPKGLLYIRVDRRY